MTEVINSPCAASRARGDCTQSSSQSGYIDISLCSQSTRARAHVREGLSPIRDHEAYFRAWRMAKFGGDFDPIRVAVDEAVEAFSSGKSEAGRSSDRRVWLKIANRVGLDRFLDAFDQKASEIGDLANRGMRLRNPAASFQKLLNARFPKTDAGREGTPTACKKASANAAARLRTESREARRSVSGAPLPCIGVDETRGGAA